MTSEMSAIQFTMKEWTALDEEIQKRFHLFFAGDGNSDPIISLDKMTSDSIPLFVQAGWQRPNFSWVTFSISVIPGEGEWLIHASVRHDDRWYWQARTQESFPASFEKLTSHVLSATDHLIANGKETLDRLLKDGE